MEALVESPELAYLIAAARDAAWQTHCNVTGLRYLERKDSIARLRGALVAYDQLVREVPLTRRGGRPRKPFDPSKERRRASWRKSASRRYRHRSSTGCPQNHPGYPLALPGNVTPAREERATYDGDEILSGVRT